MIILGKMKWNNWFSYGENNKIDFCKDTLTQIKGENGSGKSSVQLILEEVLYGKNSKNIKKVDIPNRNTKNNYLSAELAFMVDNLRYYIVYDRKSSIKLTLYKEGVDISSHTSRGTYETIQGILGLDYKTFSQLAFQDSKNSLGFLVATDAQRKAFLVSLFGLSKYQEYLNIYKEASKELLSAKSILSGECKSIDAFITKYSAMSFTRLDLLVVEDKPLVESKTLGVLEEDLRNIDKTNRAINKNNTYKTMLNNIDMSFLSYLGSKPIAPIYEKHSSKARTLANAKIMECEKEIKELEGVGSGNCPKCRQDIDKELVLELINDNEQIIGVNELRLEEAIKEAKKVQKDNKILRDIYVKDLAEYDKMSKNLSDFETLTSQFDIDMNKELVNSKVLEKSILDMKAEIDRINTSIEDAIASNNDVSAVNSKIQVVKKQLSEHRKQLSIATKKLEDIEVLEANVAALKKAFSPTGLVAYKLEFLSKTLEKQINKYLSILSSGRFQLEFILDNEKLNISIHDFGNLISIAALSSGELARVNTATLLAIRAMMGIISGNIINLLILDETLATLDSSGKESLIPLLLEEHNLNSFLISHEYSHPLLAVINVEKINGISKLEQEE